MIFPAPDAPELEGLNERQRQVVMAGGGATLVLAGAGTGKTRTLTRRVARLLRLGVRPASICLLTFTNRAAAHMQAQIEALGLPQAQQLRAGTFHAEALRALRQYGQLLGWPDDFTILGPQEAPLVMREAARRVPEAPHSARDVDRMLRLYESCVARLEDVASGLRRLHPEWLGRAPQLQAVFSGYAWEKAQMQSLDLQDLLLGWRRLLLEQPDQGAYARSVEHVLVDEFQDVNPLQAEIVDLLARHCGNLTAVGDDSQAIYGFRGADIHQILDFEQRWPQARVYRLEENYRSTAQVLRLANDSIACNKLRRPKTLCSVGQVGPLPVAVGCRNAYEEADFVAQRALELSHSGVPLSEMAILYRSHRRSAALQTALQQRELPFVLRSGLPFFEKAHIKDAMALLRALHNPRDQVSAARCLQRLDGVGAVSAQKLAALCAQENHLHRALLRAISQKTIKGTAAREVERLAQLLEALEPLRAQPEPLLQALAQGFYGLRCVEGRPEPEERLQELLSLARWSQKFEGLQALLTEISLLTGQAEQVRVGAEADQQGAVTLSTIHKAKGLEWRAVFVVGLADEWFPSQRSMADPEQLEEERRLFHVAVTRARREVYLSWPRSGRGRDGWMQGLSPSVFLRELGLEEGPEQRSRRFEIWNLERQLSLFTQDEEA